MSKSSDADFDLELHFLPAWAQKGPEKNRYAQFEGEVEREDRFGRDRRGHDRDRDRGRDRGPRRQAGPGPREMRGGPSFPQGQPQQGGPRPPRDRDRDPRRRDQGPRRGDRPAPPSEPLPEINASLITEEKGVDLLARQIKMTGRAYPLFDIAQLILAKPERHMVTLSVKKNAEGKPIQPLFVCALDETPWLSEDDAVQHLLNRHFDLFYQAERTQTEPPKGVYTFVAQCGLSGVILGPPNYHDFQNRLRKLHAEKFSRMPFESYKARVKMVRDEAIVKKWIEDQSWKTEYVCLNLPEPLKLPNKEEVEKHFRQTHLPNVIKQVETLHLSGTNARSLPCPALRRLVRHVWEEQRRFPLQVAVVLSQQFASRGLQFFKVNKTVTHVAVARPHYLDLEAVPVSEGVRSIVDYINVHPKCTRRDVVESLAPTPVAPAAPQTEAQLPPVQSEAPAAEATPVDVPPQAAPAEATASETAAQAPAQPSPATPPRAPESAEPTPEQTAVIADLHWLIHQGHVIEFANGTLETAKKPIIRPPKPTPPKTPAEPTAATESATAQTPTEGDIPVSGNAEAPPPAPAEEQVSPAETAAVPQVTEPPTESTAPELAANPASFEPVPQEQVEAPVTPATEPEKPLAAQPGPDPVS